jgi:hypothetical protein
MALPDDSVPRLSDRHLGELQDCVIGRGKFAVRGKAGHFCVAHVTRDDRPQAVKLLATGRVRLHPVGCE